MAKKPYIERDEADALAEKLKGFGWTPTVATISVNHILLGHQVGVIVEMGDERLQWEAHKSNPIANFFSIANIAAGETKNRALKPAGFNWSSAGPDSVHLSPNKGEGSKKFIDRLQAFANANNALKTIAEEPVNAIKQTSLPIQPGLFDDGFMAAESAPKRVSPRP